MGSGGSRVLDCSVDNTFKLSSQAEDPSKFVLHFCPEGLMRAVDEKQEIKLQWPFCPMPHYLSLP
jgi:hypothetical protein